MEEVRVRFAPSPTGPLHIGGVRTALYNYLFARKHHGRFILRIEDTDRTRFVAHAEDYIKESLQWLGLTVDEGPDEGGPYVPYRQSERQDMYRQFADQLTEGGHAYYAFDTPEDLEAMRQRLRSAGADTPQYNAVTRVQMQNSLVLTREEVQARLRDKVPYVIRLKVPHKEEIRLNDLVRGWVMVHSAQVDDKVLIKSDGMPTYHLANVVDDHLMKISHVIRGEEWLPSAPLHVLLYRYLGWENQMPSFAHLPLILRTDGGGKLSKRDADRLGFPIFPLNWKDPDTGETAIGYREAGYLPEALINFLTLLGWNPGTPQEVFSLEELIRTFSVERIIKGGARFDIQKAKWFNQHYIKSKPDAGLARIMVDAAGKAGYSCPVEKALKIVALMKERITFPNELVTEARYFFEAPKQLDPQMLEKWNEDTTRVLAAYCETLREGRPEKAEAFRHVLEQTAGSLGVSPGRMMQPLRVSVTGGGKGPDLMPVLEILGAAEVAERIRFAISAQNSKKEP